MKTEVKAAYAQGRCPATAITSRRWARCPSPCRARSMPGSRCTRNSASCRWPRISRRPSPMRRTAFRLPNSSRNTGKRNFAAFEKNKAMIEELDNARHTYLIDGKTPRQGQVFRNPDLANTLSEIAQGGRDAFYKGKIAHTIDAYFKRIGGDLRYSDFADFHGEWVDAAIGELSRLRRLRTAAQRPGLRRAGDAADPEGIRPEEDGRGLGRRDHRDAGSQAAGLRGSGEILRRSALRRRADEGADLGRLWRRARAS